MIAGAPHLFFGGIFAITTLILVLFAWFYRRQIDGLKAQSSGLKEGSEGIIAGLNGRIEVFEDRLECAAEKVELANQARAEVERQFKSYKEEVAANAEKATLAVTEAKVDAAIEKFSAATKAVGIAVGTLAATDDSFSNTPLALQAEADKEQLQ